jgi:hypothetical protein
LKKEGIEILDKCLRGQLEEEKLQANKEETFAIVMNKKIKSGWYESYAKDDDYDHCK